MLTVRVERLDELVLTYGFWPLDAGGAPAFAGRPDPDGRWRGPAAPPSPPTNDPVLGQLLEHTIDSAGLVGPRRVTVYLPPGHTADQELPVVYATDGQGLAAYARRVDAAIAAGTLAPVVLVGAHAAMADPVRGNLRALEYLYGFDARRFDGHQRFFVDELSAWAEADLRGLGPARPPGRVRLLGRRRPRPVHQPAVARALRPRGGVLPRGCPPTATRAGPRAGRPWCS